jgi:hypothetical protein
MDYPGELGGLRAAAQQVAEQDGGSYAPFSYHME